MKVKRMGNWYKVGKYNVVIQKDSDTPNCEPSSILVFNEDFSMNVIHHWQGEKVYDKIEKLMEKMDWKYDEVDED